MLTRSSPSSVPAPRPARWRFCGWGTACQPGPGPVAGAAGIGCCSVAGSSAGYGWLAASAGSGAGTGLLTGGTTGAWLAYCGEAAACTGAGLVGETSQAGLAAATGAAPGVGGSGAGWAASGAAGCTESARSLAARTLSSRSDLRVEYTDFRVRALPRITMKAAKTPRMATSGPISNAKRPELSGTGSYVTIGS